MNIAEIVVVLIIIVGAAYSSYTIGKKEGISFGVRVAKEEFSKIIDYLPAEVRPMLHLASLQHLHNLRKETRNGKCNN